jgi:hypothetical protein
MSMEAPLQVAIAGIIKSMDAGGIGVGIKGRLTCWLAGYMAATGRAAKVLAWVSWASKPQWVSW